MRITDSLRMDGLQRNVETGLENLNTIQRQIATGKRLNSLSDDPTGGSQALFVRAALGDNAQYQSNADQAKAFLGASDSALGSANELMQQARQIAVQGANGTQTPESLTSLADRVEGIIRQMTQIANSDVHGKYLFGGTKTNAAPFADATPADGDPTPSYTGNTGAVTATLGKGDSMTLNTTGSATFGGSFSVLQGLRAHLLAGDQTAVSNDITGVDAGLSTLNSTRATVGAKINEVDSTKQRLSRAQGDYETAVSNVEDVDLATAYVQLQSAQNVYQASLVTTSKAFQHSLSDYL